MPPRSNAVLRKPSKSFADYAAIAVAPLLIFLMISSLSNFLMLIFYHGPYPLRVAWIVLMFTMGFVAIARIAIEQDRAYSLGYAVVLGFVGFLAMTRFVGSPIFSGFILLVIAYLADRIVNDCTLIDDSVDSSGKGLVDFGRGVHRRRRNGQSQPGRTVMYLALASLPLFGLGQWMLRQDSVPWQRAPWLLAIYLFSSFSLLVTTSFLSQRRYLRQRGVEMPSNVSIAWLSGGVVLTAAIISLAYFLPLPGSMLAAVEMPRWFESAEDFSASRFGWGSEGAQASQAGDASTGPDDEPTGKQAQQVRPRKGAPPGDSGDGDGEQGPPGRQDGGKQQAGRDDSSPSQTQNPSEPSSNDNQPASQSQSQSKGNDSKAPDPTTRSEQPSSSGPEPSRNEAETGSDPSESSPGQSSSSPSESSEPSASQDSPASTKQSRGESSSPSPSRPSLGEWFSALGTLFRYFVLMVLVAIVTSYLWLHREAIRGWWLGLWATRRSDTGDHSASPRPMVVTEPPRSFASFRNPIGREQDGRRVMVVTFQAFEAWTREHGWTREKDETPSEFLQRVANSVPQMSDAAMHVVDAYNRIVYGRGRATQRDLEAAKQVWQAMT